MASVNMPKLSDTMEEGTVVEWKKKSGDTVKKGEVLAEVESDKATFDLESEADGVLKILVEQGVPAKIGAAIASIGDAGEAAEPAPESKPAAKAEAKPAPKEESKPAPQEEAKAATAKAEPAATAPAPAAHGKKPAVSAPKPSQQSAQAKPKAVPQAQAAQPKPPVHRNNAPPRPPAPINPFNSLFGR